MFTAENPEVFKPLEEVFKPLEDVLIECAEACCNAINDFFNCIEKKEGEENGD